MLIGNSLLDLVQLRLGQSSKGRVINLMWRYGAAAFAASIRRHMGWDLSRVLRWAAGRGGPALSGQELGNGSWLYEEMGDRASLFSVIVRRDNDPMPQRETPAAEG